MDVADPGGDEIVATATRTYQRPVRARLMCHSFLELVAATEPSAPVQVIYRSLDRADPSCADHTGDR